MYGWFNLDKIVVDYFELRLVLFEINYEKIFGGVYYLEIIC